MSSNEDRDLLQQITYLSRLIKRHKSAARPKLQMVGNDAYHLVRNDGPSAAQPSCSYTYIRPPATLSNQRSQSTNKRRNSEAEQYTSKSIVNHYLPVVDISLSNFKPKTILINPNFKKTENASSCIINSTQTLASESAHNTRTEESVRPKTILLNPNFKAPTTKTSIHLNTDFVSKLEVTKPQINEIFSTSKTVSFGDTVPYSVPSTSSDNSHKSVQKYSLKTNRKLVRDNIKPTNFPFISNNPSSSRSPLITINKRKLVRMSSKSEKVISDIKVHRIPFKTSNVVLYKNKKTMLDKRLLHCRKNPAKNIFKLKRSTKTLQTPATSKYKFVRAIKSKSNSKFRLDHRSPLSRIKNVKKYSLIYETTTATKRRSWQNAMLPLKHRTSSSKMYRYRKTSTSSQGPKLSEFSIRGQKYVMDSKGKTLKRITTEPSSTAETKKAPANHLKRIHVAGVTYTAKAANVYVRTNDHKTRTIVSQAKYKSIAVLVNKMRKNNQPCVFYHRFGKCIRKEKGTCPCVHDPKQIAICKKFLQGKCEVKGCLLSHDVRPEKMPTCQYFLDGCCVRDPCPYLHVKVNAHAEVCQDFLNGYCSNSNMCKKKHINICPEFDKSGKCSKGKFCPYPHKQLTQKKTHTLVSKTSNAMNNPENKDKETPVAENARYYQNDKPSGSNEQEKKSESIESEPQETVQEEVEKHITLNLHKRPKLGPLPSFIPL